MNRIFAWWFASPEPNAPFFTACAGEGVTYSEEACVLYAYRIIILSYFSDVFDPAKVEMLTECARGLAGNKIYYDLREALAYVQSGRGAVDQARLRRLDHLTTRYGGETRAQTVERWANLVA